MSDEDKTFSGSFVLDLRIWWRQAHTLYSLYRRRFRSWLLNSTSLNKTFRFPCEKGKIWRCVLTLVGTIYLAIIKHILAFYGGFEF